MDLNLTTIPYVLGKMETYGYRYKELLTIQEVENSHSLKYPKVQKVEKIILCSIKARKYFTGSEQPDRYIGIQCHHRLASH